MQADGALAELAQVEHLMHRRAGIDHGGVRGVHVEGVGGQQPAGAGRRVAVLNAEILHAQAADGRGHPAFLAAGVVDAAHLADIPADGQALEELILEDEVARVVGLGEEEV